MPIPENERQRAERELHDLLAEVRAADGVAEESRSFLLSDLFTEKPADKPKKKPVFARVKEPAQMNWAPPPQARFPQTLRKSDQRSDLVVAALGVTLGLICALFPWYIFYNDIRFTPQGFKLGGRGDRNGRIVASDQPMSTAPLTALDIPSLNLDLFPTSALAASPEAPRDAPGLDQQPFPADAAEYRLVYVANGRAMIEDDSGLWIVQPGSTLPDNSRLAIIEQRGGKWVIVTNANKVVPLTK